MLISIPNNINVEREAYKFLFPKHQSCYFFELLDSLIEKELLINGIDADFYFGVYDDKTKKYIVIGAGSPENKLFSTRFAKQLFQMDMFSNSIFVSPNIPYLTINSEFFISISLFVEAFI